MRRSMKDKVSAYNGFIRAAGGSMGVPVFDMDADFRAAGIDSKIMSDGFHPSSEMSLSVLPRLVGRCRLTISNPVLKAPMVSPLEAKI